MTHVVILGATGRAGAEVLRRLAPDTRVTAALRQPEDLSRLPAVDRPATGVVVNIEDTASIRRATAQADVVINAIRLRGDINATALVGLHGRLTEAVKTPAGPPPLIVTVGGAGALRMSDGTRFWQDPAFPQTTLPRGRAHAMLRDRLEAQPDGVSWTYLIPPPAFAPDGPHTGDYETWRPSGDESAFRGRAISYADFAEAVCAAVEGRWTGTWLVATPDQAALPSGERPG